jgi:hypothetical protein
MQRIISELLDARRKSPAKTMHAAVRESAQEIEGPPTPGELFFETGIVLTVALGAGIIVQLVMGSA